MDPKKREGGRILTVFFLPSEGRKKTVTKTQKMVEITEITKFGNICEKSDFQYFQVFSRFFFFQPEGRKKTVKIDLLRGREENLCVLPEK